MKKLLCFLGARYINVMLTLLTILLGVIAFSLYSMQKKGISVNTQGSLELYELSRGAADAAASLEKISVRLDGMERELARLRPLFIRQRIEKKAPDEVR